VITRPRERDPVVIQREVTSLMVPAGIEVKLVPGLAGYITQALGGSFTLEIEGNLFRVSGDDADAIGRNVDPAPELPTDITEQDIERLVWDRLRTCYDPEIPLNIVDLGLIYECSVVPQPDGARVVAIQMTLTAPGCGMGEVIVQDIREKVEAIPTVDCAEVTIVFDPPWDASMMSDAARLHTGMF
jgi:probable FeS assembly SUF system protein SufT